MWRNHVRKHSHPVYGADDLKTPKRVQRGCRFVIEKSVDVVDASCDPELYTLENIMASNIPIESVPLGQIPMSDEALDDCVGEVFEHFNNIKDEMV